MAVQSRLLQSIASSWLALGIGVVVSFFLSPFVVAKLGSAWYGVWAVAAQFTGYLYLLDFGVRESVIRYTSKYCARGQGSKLNRILTVSVMIYAGVTLVALALTAICAWGVPYWLKLEPQLWAETRAALIFTGLTIAQTFLFNIFTGILIGVRRWDIANVMGIAINLARAALIVLFLGLGYGIVALAAIQFAVAVLSGLATMIVALVLLRRNGLRFALVRLDRRSIQRLSKRVFGYGFYVLVNNVGEKIITATDAIVVGIFLPISSVAYYAVAGSLVGYLRQLVASTAQVFNPLASHLHALRQGTELRNMFLLGAKLNVLITLPIAATYAALGVEFVGLWMGEEFAAPSGQVLLVLALMQILAAPQYMISSLLYGISRHRTIAILRLIEGAANLALSIVLVKRVGLVGVALGSAIPNVIIVLGVLPTIACRFVGMRLRDYFHHVYLRPLAAIAPFTLAALWVREHLPASNLLVFFVHVAGLMCIYLPCAFFVILNADERRAVVQRMGFKWAWQ